MNSPLFLKITIIAIVFAILGYFAASLIEPSQLLVAIAAFAGALIAPFITQKNDDNNADQSDVKTLYVGNLPYRANEAAVRRLFSDYGFVHSVRLMKDKQTGKRRGFGFVEMTASDAGKAISALNDSEFQQRTLKVREAKERPERCEENIQE
jgi:RNA recognition motif-containing protein